MVVWQKAKVGEVYCAAYTDFGLSYISQTLMYDMMKKNNSYEMGATHPKDFISKAPKGLKIGGVSLGAKVPMLINPPLH